MNFLKAVRRGSLLHGAAILAVCTGLSVSTAFAQRPNAPLPKQDTPLPTEQQRCAPRNETVNPSMPETRGQGSHTPSEELSKSDGVICPPAGVDPEITTPPPGGGRTPVIPPPGTPGGNPNVVPK